MSQLFPVVEDELKYFLAVAQFLHTYDLSDAGQVD